jgi:hypothetical protein
MHGQKVNVSMAGKGVWSIKTDQALLERGVVNKFSFSMAEKAHVKIQFQQDS